MGNYMEFAKESMSEEYLSLSWWYKYLKEKGFWSEEDLGIGLAIDSFVSPYYRKRAAAKGRLFYYYQFVVWIEKITLLPWLRFCWSYKIKSSFPTKVNYIGNNYLKDPQDMIDIFQVIDAIVDPSKAPLLRGISGTEKLMALLLEAE